MKLSDIVVTEAIVPNLIAIERDEVINELIGALVAAGAVKPAMKKVLIDEIISREKGGSTGFGKGVAVPHVKHDKIKTMTAAIGLSQAGIDFNALDNTPVHMIVLLLSPKQQPDEHLQAMENIFSKLQNETFRRFLRQATTVEAVVDLIQEADTQYLKK